MKTTTYDETQWRLVPIEPTDEMTEAMMEASITRRPSIDDDSYVGAIWDAAICNTSTPPAEGQSNTPEFLDNCGHPQPDAQAIRNAALEEAARIVENTICDGSIEDRQFTAEDAALSIRALKSQPAQQDADERQAHQAITFVHELAMGAYQPEQIEARAKAIARMAPLTVQQEAANAVKEMRRPA